VKVVEAPEPGVRGRLVDWAWDHPRSKGGYAKFGALVGRLWPSWVSRARSTLPNGPPFARSRRPRTRPSRVQNGLTS
jgi:hypothetical protein